MEYLNFMADVYQVDSAEAEGCPYWEPVSEEEEERRNEALGCIVMFLLLPVLLIMKIV